MDTAPIPPTTDISAANWLIVMHGFMALFGALVHAISAHRNGTSKSFLDFALLTMMSSFSGVVFALVAVQVFDNPYMTLAVTGAGGFLGVEGLSVLSLKLRDSIVYIMDKTK